MNRKIICTLTCAMGLALFFMGCGNRKEEPPTIPVESIEEAEQLTEQATESAIMEETGETEIQDISGNLTFTDLAKYSYEFYSGAGGWSEEFNIEKDGSFHGLFHDSDMGVTGDGYPDGVRFWFSDAYGNTGDTLQFMGIVDEKNEYGIRSTERLNPLEEAEMTLNSYRESYEYFDNLLSESATTQEMVENSGGMYGISDDCLNEIW